MNPEILAIIPARGGSKGIPRKNIKTLADVPLFVYTIEAAMDSRLISRTVVSTEDEEIAWTVWEYGAETIDRPKELATDFAPTEPVLEHAVKHLEGEGYKADIIVLLQPTSPLRNGKHIDHALVTFFMGGYDSLLSVCNSHAYIWSIERGQACPLNWALGSRQLRQLRDPEYKENGAIYITKRDILMSEHNRLGGKIGLYVMPEEDSLEIDNEFDFWLCEAILEQRRTKESLLRAV